MIRCDVIHTDVQPDWNDDGIKPWSSRPLRFARKLTVGANHSMWTEKPRHKAHSVSRYQTERSQIGGIVLLGCKHRLWGNVSSRHGKRFILFSTTCLLQGPSSIYAIYSISQEICTRFLLCCALLWLYIDWFSHIHQAYFTGTVV